MDLTQRTESFGADDQRWLASSHGMDAGVGITLDTSAFTPATHYPSGYFLSGIPLGKITATGLYGPYSDAASDGTQTCTGFLFTPQRAPKVNTVDVGGVMLVHGSVAPANLPVALDAAGKADLAAKFIFV